MPLERGQPVGRHSSHFWDCALIQVRTLHSVKHIHPIPTASVSEGDNFVIDIREGEQSEIVFRFIGTPPFAFTYSRRKPQDRYKDKTVLETHTVT